MPTLKNTSFVSASNFRIAIVGTLFAFIWSSAFIAGKVGMTAAGPLTLLCLRFLLAAALVVPIIRSFAPRIPLVNMNCQGLWLALASGLLTNAVYLGLTYTGMKSVPAGLTAILVSTNPLMTSLLAAAWFKEPFGWRGALGLLSGFAGVVVIMWERAAALTVDGNGITLILVGTSALAVATLINRRAIGHMSLWHIAFVQLLGSGLALLPVAIWLEELAFVPNVAFFSSLLYQATVVSIGTTVMLLWLIRHGGAARASSFHLLNPVFGTLLAIVLLDERVSIGQMLGIVPIVAGLALVNGQRK